MNESSRQVCMLLLTVSDGGGDGAKQENIICVCRLALSESERSQGEPLFQINNIQHLMKDLFYSQFDAFAFAFVHK